MTADQVVDLEWGLLGREVAALWPNSRWPAASVVKFTELAGDQIPLSAALAAVVELAKTGLEFAPPPGMVYAYAKPIADAARPPVLELEEVATPDPKAQERGLAKVRAAVEAIGQRKISVAGEPGGMLRPPPFNEEQFLAEQARMAALREAEESADAD